MRYIQVLLLLLLLFVLLPKADGDFDIENSDFKYRKQMLENANITVYPQPKLSRIDKWYYQDQHPSPHNCSLLINEETMCSQHKNVFLLIAIRTIYSHLERRKILRESFHYKPTVGLNVELIVKHVFLFGKTRDQTTEKLIRSESKEYKDILQEDFIESYSNLTYKTVMAWKWSVEYCPNAVFVMVVNDEVFIDIEKTLSFLLLDLIMGHVDDHFAICYPIGNGPVIHFRMKQFLVLDRRIMYKGKIAPLYCHGYGYAAHITVINKLYKLSQNNPFFMPDDMWLGVLTEKLRLKMPRLRYLFVRYNLEEYFAAEDYQLRPAMIAICDHEIYKGHESSTQRKLLTLLQQHWNKSTRVQKSWQTAPQEERQFLSTKFLAVYFACIIFMVLFIQRFLRHIKCYSKLKRHA